jgi:UDP-glucose:(heptosyl)LPS alpha-1,3-glucosyltransferase
VDRYAEFHWGVATRGLVCGNFDAMSALKGPCRSMPRPRIAVVSPFIDKRHGTERSVAECIQRLSSEYEIHVYSHRVEDVDLEKITWHRIPALPGPHLLGFTWWFLANHLWRWWDRRFRGLTPEIIFSPGINCLDANAIQVHIVFAERREQMRDQLLFLRSPWNTWHEILHRRIYYSLISFLERRIYPRPGVSLVVVSRKTADDLSRFYGRTSNVQVAYHGLDLERFQPARRAALRDGARRQLSLSNGDFAVLLIGNDWKCKGLACLLNAVGHLGDSNLTILVVGRDNPAPFQDAIQAHGLTDRVRFLPPRPDVEFYYAVADAYASPTLEDSFGLPPAEAMACGLPVITSRAAGVSELIHSGQDGFVLEQPSDFLGLARILQKLVKDPQLRDEIAEKAVTTARKLTWENTAAHIRASWEQARTERAPDPAK